MAHVLVVYVLPAKIVPALVVLVLNSPMFCSVTVVVMKDAALANCAVNCAVREDITDVLVVLLALDACVISPGKFVASDAGAVPVPRAI